MDGTSQPFKGFFPPGTTLTLFRRNWIEVDGSKAYGEQVNGSWGFHREEYTFQGTVGSDLISVSVIARNDPRRSAAEGIREVEANLTATSRGTFRHTG